MDAQRRVRLLIAGLLGIALGVTGSELFTPAALDANTSSVRIVESELGRLSITTRPGATCQAVVALPTGQTRPHKVGDPVVVGLDGRATWTYQASAPSAGLGAYTVTCGFAGTSYTARAQFKVEDRD